MARKVHIGFEQKGVVLPLKQILPIRQLKTNDYGFGKYRAVTASIREIGLVEPLVVYPQLGDARMYLLLDGQPGRSHAWSCRH
jgi:ParB-like chromosome segregation protein Spo0J